MQNFHLYGGFDNLLTRLNTYINKEINYNKNYKGYWDKKITQFNTLLLW